MKLKEIEKTTTIYIKNIALHEIVNTFGNKSCSKI